MENSSDKILIVPLGGNDYNSLVPRFLSPYQGDVRHQTMFHKSLEEVHVHGFDMILVIVFDNPHLHQHLHFLNIGIEENEFLKTQQFEIIHIKPTKSVAETVYMGLKKFFNPNKPGKFELEIDDSEIYIKDFDEKVTISEPLYPNTVYNWSLNKGNITDVEKKSYIRTNPNNTILNIVEKDVISSQFSVGFYSFKKLTDFTTTFENLKQKGIKNEIYISHIIYQLILSGQQFQTIEVDEYIDLGNDILWEKWVEENSSEQKHKGQLVKVYGCSNSGWTIPAFLKEDEEDLMKNKLNLFWGRQLSEKLGMECEIVSLPGKSIHQIAQRIIYDITKNSIGANPWNKDNVIILSPSYMERFQSNVIQVKKDGTLELENNENHWNFIDKFGFIKITEGDIERPFSGINQFNQISKEFKLNQEILVCEWFYTTMGIFKLLKEIYPNTFLWFLEDTDFIHLHISKILEKHAIATPEIIMDIKRMLSDKHIIKCTTHDSWDEWIKNNCWEHPTDSRLNDGHMGIEGHSKFGSYLYKEIKNLLVE